MLHVCVHRFDVMGTVEIYLELNGALAVFSSRKFLGLATVVFLLLFGN